MTTLVVMGGLRTLRLMLALLAISVVGGLAACGGDEPGSIERAIVELDPTDDDSEVPPELETLGEEAPAPAPAIIEEVTPTEGAPEMEETAPPTTVEEPAPPPTPSAPPTGPPPADPEPLPEGAALTGGALEPGRYTPQEFEPAISFELGEGWTGLQRDFSDFLSISRGPDDELSLSFLSPRAFEAVLDPETDYTRDPTSDDLIDPLTVDFAELLRTHRHYTSGPVVSTTIGGHPAILFESAVTSGYDYELCPGECVLLFATSDGSLFGSLVGYRERTLVVDVAGQPMLISISAPMDQFADFVGTAEEVLATLLIAGVPVAEEPPAPPPPPPAATEPAPSETPPAEPPVGEPEVFDPGVELPDRSEPVA